MSANLALLRKLGLGQGRPCPIQVRAAIITTPFGSRVVERAAKFTTITCIGGLLERSRPFFATAQTTPLRFLAGRSSAATAPTAGRPMRCQYARHIHASATASAAAPAVTDAEVRAKGSLPSASQLPSPPPATPRRRISSRL